MSSYGYQPPQPYASPAQNLQFYPSSYAPNAPVSGQSTPFQAGYGAPPNNAYGYGGQPSSYGPANIGFGGAAGFGAGPGVGGVSGRMGEQGGLRTGWLAAFGTEGYEGEPPLLEELGVNFGHIKMKVCGTTFGFETAESFGYPDAYENEPWYGEQTDKLTLLNRTAKLPGKYEAR